MIWDLNLLRSHVLKIIIDPHSRTAKGVVFFKDGKIRKVRSGAGRFSTFFASFDMPAVLLRPKNTIFILDLGPYGHILKPFKVRIFKKS